jgi:hypothetical protein
MSILTELTSTAVDAVGTLRTKAAEVVVDVRKQLPLVEPKKVQSVVVEGALSARKQVIDLTARGEKIVRDLTGRSASKPAAKSATASATKPATKPATKKVAAKRTVARKTTTAKRTVKKAAPSTKN